MLIEQISAHEGSIYTVRKIYKQNYMKKIVFDQTNMSLIAPISSCVLEGNRVNVKQNDAWVICQNGKAKFLEPYCQNEMIAFGGLKLSVRIKEITDESEYISFQKLSSFHYRDNAVHGKTSSLIVSINSPMYPRVIGYIELATPLYMSKPRSELLNSPFELKEVKWDLWDKGASRHYINTIVRISRCVVYPEFRGLGLGQLLVKHAIIFAKNRWQSAGLKPFFLEISADMLKYVPFVEKSGMHYIGDTEGNLGRVYKDMKYLMGNSERIRNGEIISANCGIVDQQVARMERMQKICEQDNINSEVLLERLKRLSIDNALRDFSLFYNIVSLPKPTYFMGLNKKAETFVMKRIQELNILKENKHFCLDIEPICSSIRLENLYISYLSAVKRTSKTHAIQQAFGISPDNINTKVVNNLSIEILPGEILFVTGSSGSGKTTFLNLLTSYDKSTKKMIINGTVHFPLNYNVGSFHKIRSQKALIEIFDIEDIDSALDLMGVVGLSDAFIYLKRFDELSKGQQYRAMLAQLIIGSNNVWIVDEFCTNLDSITSNVVASKLRQLAKKIGVTLIIAAPNYENFIEALSPDKVLVFTSTYEHSFFSGIDFLNVIKGK